MHMTAIYTEQIMDSGLGRLHPTESFAWFVLSRICLIGEFRGGCAVP